MQTPILFITFNRPHIAKRVFDAILKYNPSRLYIAVDGPRNKEDEKQVAKTLQFLNLIPKTCKVKTLIREKNLGCNISVTEAISWFFKNEEEGIILEDDCLPSPSFFEFCEKLLIRYREDSRISIISGTNYLLDKFDLKSDYYYSNMTHIWGWASWRRVWEGYTLKVQHYKKFKESKILNRIFTNYYVRKHFDIFYYYMQLSKMPLKSIAWDYRFVYHNLLNHRLSIIPSKNLISNIGSPPSKKFIYANMYACQIDTSNLKAPNVFLPFYEADEFTFKNEYKIFSIIGIWNFYKRLFRYYVFKRILFFLKILEFLHLREFATKIYYKLKSL